MTELVTQPDDHSEARFRDKYFERVKTAEPDTLQQLIDDMMSEKHDYGTICLALGFSAAATAWSLNHDSRASGGITGFQAGAVFWTFAAAWGMFKDDNVGVRLVDYDELLYPQYAERFEKTITPDMARAVKEKAAKLLREHKAQPTDEPFSQSVVDHWQRLALGNLPFGFTVKDR